MWQATPKKSAFEPRARAFLARPAPAGIRKCAIGHHHQSAGRPWMATDSRPARVRPPGLIRGARTGAHFGSLWPSGSALVTITSPRGPAGAHAGDGEQPPGPPDGALVGRPSGRAGYLQHQSHLAAGLTRRPQRGGPCRRARGLCTSRGSAWAGCWAHVAVLDHPAALSALALVGTRSVAPGPPDDDLVRASRLENRWFRVKLRVERNGGHPSEPRRERCKSTNSLFST